MNASEYEKSIVHLRTAVIVRDVVQHDLALFLLPGPPKRSNHEAHVFSGIVLNSQSSASLPRRHNHPCPHPNQPPTSSKPSTHNLIRAKRDQIRGSPTHSPYSTNTQESLPFKHRDAQMFLSAASSRWQADTNFKLSPGGQLDDLYLLTSSLTSPNEFFLYLPLIILLHTFSSFPPNSFPFPSSPHLSPSFSCSIFKTQCPTTAPANTSVKAQ
jgi:hypothetical protein